MRRWALPCVLLLGCSKPLDDRTVGFQLEPPKGMAHVKTEAGEIPVARFEGGLEIRSLSLVEGAPIQGELSTLLDALKARLPSLGGTSMSARTGTLPAGPVARYELVSNDTRTLVYIVDGSPKDLVLTLTAPKSEFEKRSMALERVIATLRF